MIHGGLHQLLAQDGGESLVAVGQQDGGLLGDPRVEQLRLVSERLRQRSGQRQHRQDCKSRLIVSVERRREVRASRYRGNSRSVRLATPASVVMGTLGMSRSAMAGGSKTGEHRAPRR